MDTVLVGMPELLIAGGCVVAFVVAVFFCGYGVGNASARRNANRRATEIMRRIGVEEKDPRREAWRCG